MKYLDLFLWGLAPLCLGACISLVGTPHLVVSYRYYDNGARYDPLAPRQYISCTYYGWTGWNTVPATDGQCPWIRFFKAETSQ